VAQLFAVTQMLADGSLDPQDIGLLYVVEEETTSRGALASNELGLTPAYLLVGEPTELNLAAGHKGGISFVANSVGKESHSGYPELGVSAIDPLVEFLGDLLRQQWPNDTFFGQSTINIGKINGGVAANVVPAAANASVYIRAAVPVATIKAQILQVAIPYPNITFTWISEKDPFRCDVVPGFQTEVFAYGTDLPSFHSPNHKSYLFGPGSILVAHTDGEYINKTELTYSIGEYKRLITAILAQG